MNYGEYVLILLVLAIATIIFVAGFVITELDKIHYFCDHLDKLPEYKEKCL